MNISTLNSKLCDLVKKSSPVFSCKETRERFLASLRTRGDVEEQETWDWLRTPPRDTIVRVNLNVMSREEAIVKLREHLGICGRTVEPHPTLGEVVIIPGRSTKDSTVESVTQGKYVKK